MQIVSRAVYVPLAGLLFACAAPQQQRPANGAPVASAFLVSLGESQRVENNIVTPVKLLEDSRCPTGVQCIQAGTVRLQVTIRKAQKDRLVEVGLNEAAEADDLWLHLLDACPYPRHPEVIAKRDYRFVLALTPGPAFEGPSLKCA